MKDINGLRSRLRRITPAPISQSEIEEAEFARLWMPLYRELLPRRLEEYGCGDIIDEMLVALETVTRPFDHMHAGDRPVWVAIDEVSDRHHEMCYAIRAAETAAGADAMIALGESEDSEIVQKFRQSAAGDLERDRKEKQTTCDRCGRDLCGKAWYNGGTMEKLCKTCMGL